MAKRRAEATRTRTTTRRATGKKTAKATHSSRRVKKPRVGGIAITSTGALHRARERVRDRLGSDFAAKATDEVLILIGRVPDIRTAAGRAAAVAARTAPPASLVVELRYAL